MPALARLLAATALPRLYAALALAGLSTAPAVADNFLPPKLAFKPTAAVADGALTVRYEIAPGYYLYRDRLGFESATPGVEFGKPSFPAGEDHEDDYFGKQVVYRGVIAIGVPLRLTGPPRDFELKLKLQGCADAGLCYPPQTWPIKVETPDTVRQATVGPAGGGGESGADRPDGTVGDVGARGTNGATDAAAALGATGAASTADTAVAAGPAATAEKGGSASGRFSLRRLLGGGPKSNADFLPVDKAFVLSTSSASADRIELRFVIADDYYLYRDKTKVRVLADTVQLGAPRFPDGEVQHDEYFGEQVVYRGEFVAQVPVSAAAGTQDVPLEVRYQGCADAGLCYPPTTRQVTVRLAATTTPVEAGSASASGVPGGSNAASGVLGSGASGPSPVRSETDVLAARIRSGNLLAVLATFFGAGLLLALTPCVLPMVPILSGIIVGAGRDRPVSRGRAFSLSLAYVLGMALTYTIAGAAFAAAGQQAQAFFQKPWIIAGFAGLFVLLALGMFGVFNLQVPGWLQARVASLSDHQQQGTLTGTAVMGALSSLIVTACVAPPLVAALAVIGQSGDVLRGASALFALSLGMGMPLLLVGASAGQLLPKAGPWMDAVKTAFGVMLLGVAIWMLDRILPGPVTLALWAALAFVTGYCLMTLGSREARGGFDAVRRGFGALALVYGVLLLVGALAGRTDPLQPLAGLGSVGRQAESVRHVEFTRIKSIGDLERELATARAAGQPVMLDFYADWCVSCKEMERYTFTDAGVQAEFARARLLQADVTANDAEDQALLQHFGILGPPTIVFFDATGRERPEFRVVGFKPAEEFRPHLAAAFAGNAA